MINKINHNQIQNIPAKGSQAKKASPQPDSKAGPDASVRVDHQGLIADAQKSQAADAKAVAQARKMLLSGRLDSIENIEKAAKNIMDFGI